MSEFNELTGKTITSFCGGEGDDYINITCSDGTEYAMFHKQSCCEDVYISQITGDVGDIVGSPILSAEEATNSDYPEEGTEERNRLDQECTWTFYKLATIKGYLDITWFGTSNGYYSESVDFVKIK